MLAIGIDLGGTSFKYGLVDENGTILFKDSYLIKQDCSQEQLIYILGEHILDFIKIHNVSIENIKGIGVGCPGSVNTKDGICEYSNNLRFENLKLCEILKDVTSLDVKMLNDADAACLCEYVFGNGKQYSNILFVTLGTGVGSGIIMNKKLILGHDANGIELGHTLVKSNGIKCTCGRKGCFESYASASALIRETKEAMIKDKSSKMWNYCNNNIEEVSGLTSFECAKKGDKTAQKVLRTYIKYLGEGLLNGINCFRPEAIFIGGGLSNQRDYLINMIKKYLKKNNYGFGTGKEISIFVSSFVNDAGILGGASIIFQK